MEFNVERNAKPKVGPMNMSFNSLPSSETHSKLTRVF
jgi:hypothetical protein